MKEIIDTILEEEEEAKKRVEEAREQAKRIRIEGEETAQKTEAEAREAAQKEAQQLLRESEEKAQEQRADMLRASGGEYEIGKKPGKRYDSLIDRLFNDFLKGV
ncbi:hypothetical protein JXO52_02850 [bacterium]|nr:hypothetical protein [bacterium]